MTLLSNTHTLINCSNLHAGGGVAVATSLLTEFSRMPQQAERLTVLASSEVAQNLREIDANLSAFADFVTFDVQGTRAFATRKPVGFTDFDAVFTVFGPLYAPVRGPLNIVGFAQAWVAYPRNSAHSMLPATGRIKSRLKYTVQAALFARADVLVVEHEHVRTALKTQRLFRDKRIEVVPNVVDNVILEPSLWKPIDLPQRSADLRLGVVSHNYPHKNLAILPKVREALMKQYCLGAEFFVTFPESDYRACSSEFKAAVKNVGTLQLAQSPSFNTQLDGVVFPTLLECFSATPIEALATRTPLFASDRPFVRDTVGGHGVFFDPLDPEDIARSIAAYFERPSDERLKELDEGYEYVTGGGYTSRDRALATLRIIDG